MCNKNFSLKDHLKRQIASVHEDKKSYTCELCTKSFYYKYCFKGHISEVHEGKIVYQCKLPYSRQ